MYFTNTKDSYTQNMAIQTTNLETNNILDIVTQIITDDYSCNSVNFKVRTSRFCMELDLDNI